MSNLKLESVVQKRENVLSMLCPGWRVLEFCDMVCGFGLVSQTVLGAVLYIIEPDQVQGQEQNCRLHRGLLQPRATSSGKEPLCLEQFLHMPITCQGMILSTCGAAG